jgi:hypothetical protein
MRIDAFAAVDNTVSECYYETGRFSRGPMLPIEQIIPFIRHPDPWVVDLAMRRLEWVRWPGRLTGDFVLDAVRDGHDSLATWLSRFEPSPAVLDYAIGVLAAQKSAADEAWPHGVIARAHDAMFTPAVIEALRNVRVHRGFVAEQIRLRSEMTAWPTQRLRDELLAACDVADEDGSARSQHRQISELADRLVYRGDSVEWAADELAKRLGSNKWSEIWLLAILIKAQHRPALDIALRRWPQSNPDENESLIIECSTAISELATAADIPAIAGLWDALGDEGNRSYLLEAIGRLRFPEAEGVLLDFARQTDDPTLLTYAGIGLCEMLCTGDDALQFLRDMVDREEFDTTHVELEELAIPLGIIIGRPFPEEDAWRKRLEDPHTRQERRSRFRNLFGPNAAAMLEQLDRLREARQGDGLDALAVARGELPPALATERPAQLTRAATVGRNDPCPCGSGKKYKKCCLNKGSS